MGAWIETTFIQQKADQLQTMVQALLINKVRENSGNPDASSDQESFQEMTDEERSQGTVKIFAKVEAVTKDSLFQKRKCSPCCRGCTESAQNPWLLLCVLATSLYF